MKNLILQREGDSWVRMLGQNNRAFAEYLRYNVNSRFRKYDTVTRAWMVYWRELRKVVAVAKRYYAQIDWSTLPEGWQMYLAGADYTPPVNDEPPENPYAVLFVSDDAPLEVVRAAYKALVGLRHPDVGGSTAEMARINQAYTAIVNMRHH